jgi:acetyl-CoA C-acetyltransferase
MGISNELCSERYHMSREDQDRYAAESYRRPWRPSTAAVSMTKSCPWTIPSARGSPKSSPGMNAPGKPYEALARMKPAFKKDGFGTAGNASIISDGAAAVVVMSREKAEALGCTVMAAIGAQASYGIDMKYVLVAPIWAIPKCLKKEGIGLDDVDCSRSTRLFQDPPSRS